MATVIEFRKSTNKSAGSFGPAQILMFTGVRQERLVTEPTQVKTKRRLVTQQSQVALEEPEL